MLLELHAAADALPLVTVGRVLPGDAYRLLRAVRAARLLRGHQVVTHRMMAAYVAVGDHWRVTGRFAVAVAYACDVCSDIQRRQRGGGVVCCCWKTTDFNELFMKHYLTGLQA